MQSGSFTALGCCNRAAVYCIRNDLNENGYVLLNTDDGCICNLRCGCTGDDFSELTDASITRIGNETFFIGAFPKSAYLFEASGKRLTRLCLADNDEILTDFISFGEEKYAMSTIRDGLRTVSISENGITRSGILNKRLSLRMLFAENEVVYGLFGQSYIYNRIIPIYRDGIFTLPESLENCFCSC